MRTMGAIDRLLHVEPPEPERWDSSLNARVLSRYADVEAALHDNSLVGGVGGEWHARYRAAALAAFTGRNLAEWRRMMNEEAHRLCERLRLRRAFDLVDDYARPLSGFAAKLVTRLDLPEAPALATAIFTAAAEPFVPDLQAQGNEATARLVRLFDGETATLYVQAYVALSESLPAFLANGLYVLLRDNERAHSPTAIEELLRYAGPAKAQLRMSSEGPVVLMLASANRDPTVFIEPNQLKLTRQPNKHLAFGAGPHSCLGAALIRMAATGAFSVLFEAFPSLVLESATARQSFAFRAIDSLRASPSTTPRPAPH